MGIIGSWLLLAAVAAAPADTDTDTAWQSPPAELRGVWFEQDPEQVQCQRLLQARDPWEHEGSVLIGALWIDDRVLHNWADYGEGDIHRVVRSVQVAPTQWQLEVSAGIDTWPDLEQDGSFPLWLSLSEGVLVWHQQTGQGYTRAWQRCSDLPQRPDED